MIATIKGRHRIRRVIIVCDRGMVSKDNLKQLRSEGYEYIVGMRMRQLKHEDAAKVLDKEKMQAVTASLKVRAVEYEDQRLIVCYNWKVTEEIWEHRKPASTTCGVPPDSTTITIQANLDIP